MTVTAPPPGDVSRTHPLRDEVLHLVEEVRAAAVADGEEAAAAALEVDVARLHRGAAGVVVVGEKKRGKSSLLNALVDHPGLLPVDADVATCVHVVVAHGATARARATDAGGAHDIALAEVVDYAAVAPGTAEPAREGVSGVAAEVPSPLLARGLELVDTPGVGGLVAGHAALTLATLDRADALLFVLDGSSEITASELAFLERATERTATVVFALTKTDLFPAWEEVLLRNLELVGAHAPRYADAPWFAVSSRARADAHRALAAGRPEIAERRLAASGLPELEAHLGRLAEGADALRLADTVAQATALAKRLAATQVRQAMSLTLAPEFAESVAAEKAKLTALQGQNATWRATLAERTMRVEQHARTELSRRLEDLRKDLGDMIAAGGSEVFAATVKDLPPRAQAIWVDMDTILRRELTATVAALLADLDDVDVDISGVVPDLPERLAQLPEASRGKGGTSLAEHGVMAMSLGMMVGSIISAIPGMLPVGIAAGVGVVGLFSHRRHQKEKAAKSREDARRHLGEVTGRLGTEIPPVISQAVVGTRDLLTRAVSAALAAEKERLTASLAEHERHLATERTALARRKAEVEQKLRARSTMRESGTELARRLRPDGAGAPTAGGAS